jgi:hypothetical protein
MMPKCLKLVILLAVVTTLVLATGATTSRQTARSSRAVRVLTAKDRSTLRDGQEEKQDRQVPVAEYNAPEPSDPAKRTLRRIRSKRNDVRDSSLKPDDVSRLVLTERSTPVNLGGPWSHAPAEPAIPITQSDAVLIGDIVGADAYLSNDKTSIYSEFAVAVSDILKDTSSTILTGNRITIERSGGALRFPSGKILIRGLLGKPLPKMTGRYVFFLKRDEEGEDFSLITAYELRGGKVFPLDGLSPKDEVIEPFAAYQQYKGADESTFIAKLWGLIQSPPDVPEKRLE